MGVKISLSGLNVSDNASVMNNVTVTGKDVEIEMEDMFLSNSASVLDMAHIEQKEENPAPKEKKPSLRSRFSSLCENVAANLISDAITKK